MIQLHPYPYKTVGIDPEKSSVHKFAAVAAKANEVFPATSRPEPRIVPILATALIRAAAFGGYSQVLLRENSTVARSLSDILRARTVAVIAIELRNRLKTQTGHRPSLRPLKPSEPSIRTVFDHHAVDQLARLELIDRLNSAAIDAVYCTTLYEAMATLRKLRHWAVNELVAMIDRLIANNTSIFHPLSDAELATDYLIR